MEILKSYNNGNCSVSIYSDGTKVREWEGKSEPVFPESMDVKITDWCDAGCSWCHEQSTKKGKHSDISFLKDTLGSLPSGVEIAIGGGDPFSYPNLEELLLFIKDKGVIANITVNSKHLSRSKDRINYFRENKMVYGIGISYDSKYHEDVKDVMDANSVLHVISGVNTVSEVMSFPKNWKLLVLGYKTYGFGKKYYEVRPVKENLNKWKYWIGTIMNKFHVSFDNLAVKQLGIKKYLTEEKWNESYMGDDGSFTMYIDAVEQNYAKSSTSKRIEAKGLNVKEMFSNVKKLNKDLEILQ